MYSLWHKFLFILLFQMLATSFGLNRSSSGQIRGSFQKFCTLYVFSLKMNLFYKIHLQAFSVISIVLYHRGPMFGHILYFCQDAFIVDASDYPGHLVRHLLSAFEAFPMEWFLQFWEQVKGWWAYVRTVQWVGKYLPSILFQNFQYCTWGIRPCVNVWSVVTAQDLTPVSFFSHFKAPFCRTDHVTCQYAHIVLYWSLAHNCHENQNDCNILLAMQAQCAECLKWPTYL